MSNTVIKVENLSKLYRLGEVGTGTVSHDLNRWFAKIRGKEDPFALVGQVNDRTQKSESEYVWALKDINFEVKQGEVLGIIGKNGAGKSTLLKLLSQITSPTTGEIKVKGRIAALLEVGTGMHPEMTARENIFLNGAIMGMRKHEIKSKFDEIIDFAGCAMYVDTPIKRFSSGMRVRLGFAVAAFLEPEILIVDEVLAVGDAEFQKKAIGKMQDVSAKEGRTVLFVSHNLGTIGTLCNRTIIIQNGKKFFDGNTKEGLDLYTSNNAQILFNPEKREGSKNVIISDLILKRHNNVSVNFQSGDKVIIEFKLNGAKAFFGKKIELGAQIYNSKGMFISALNNMTRGNTIIFEKDNQVVKCIIDKLPFTNGRHFINVGLIIDGVLNDYVEEALLFDVIPADYYGVGYNKLEKREGIYIEHEWI